MNYFTKLTTGGTIVLITAKMPAFLYVRCAGHFIIDLLYCFLITFETAFIQKKIDCGYAGFSKILFCWIITKVLCHKYAHMGTIITLYMYFFVFNDVLNFLSSNQWSAFILKSICLLFYLYVPAFASRCSPKYFTHYVFRFLYC